MSLSSLAEGAGGASLARAKASTKATIEWIKNHAGLWTFGIFVIVVLGVVGAFGIWALEGQKKAVLAIVEQKEASLKGEIDSTREILERLEKSG